MAWRQTETYSTDILTHLQVFIKTLYTRHVVQTNFTPVTLSYSMPVWNTRPYLDLYRASFILLLWSYSRTCFIHSQGTNWTLFKRSKFASPSKPSQAWPGQLSSTHKPNIHTLTAQHVQTHSSADFFSTPNLRSPSVSNLITQKYGITFNIRTYL